MIHLRDRFLMTLQTIILIMNQQSYKSCRLCCYILYNSKNNVLNMQDSTVAQKCHSNFNFLTAISICSGQFQFAHGNFNLFREISICSRKFQFTHGNFNLLTAISIYSGRFRNFTPKAISIFSRQRSRHFSFLSPPVGYGGRQWPRTKSQNAKSKVDI